MRTALTFWRRSPVSAPTSSRTLHRPDEVNWIHIAMKFALGLIFIGNLAAPFMARAQNLGTSPNSAKPCKASKRLRSKALFSTS